MTYHSWPSTAHREAMTSYYHAQAPIYDLTRRMILFGREQVIHDLHLREGETVIEVGCGTGGNLAMIRAAIGETGELLALDCSEPMLRKARDRVQRAGWKNVRIIDHEYGNNTITRGEANVVLFSYSLSMIPSWRAALNCASGELESNGRIGIVDFCGGNGGPLFQIFAAWMSRNHVDVRRRYQHELNGGFETRLWSHHRVLGDAWCYFRYVGSRKLRAVTTSD